MRNHILAGYQIRIDPIFADVSTNQDTPCIDSYPASKSASGTIADESSAIEFIKEFFSA